MTINSIDVVIYTAWFVLPGYIITRIINTLCPERKISDAINLLKCIGYSLIDIALWIWLYKICIDCNNKAWWHYLLLTVVVVSTSTLTGLAIGLIRYCGFFRWLVLKVFKIQIEKPIPTAWDNIFSSRKFGCWVIVTLGNGKHIGGRFSTNSHASSDQDYRDLFLEETYEVDENGWIKTPNTEGVWLSPDEIKKIEFIGDGNNE